MTGFLDLPGEIRNRIYSLVFPEQQILLRSSHPKQKKAIKSTPGSWDGKSSKSSAQLCAVSPHDAGHQPVTLSAPLLRVCRKVREEALPLLYSSVALHCASLKVTNRFLNRASRRGLEQITKLAIVQSGYGEPHLTSNRKWKMKHDQKWMSTCQRIAQTMTGLKHLKLSLQICDWPTQLNLSAAWAQPLFFLKGPHGLDQVDLYLRSNSFSQQRLQATARVVERAMMSEQGYAQRQLTQSLQEIARLEKQQHPQTTRQILKDTTNVAQGMLYDQGIKKPKVMKVLTIRMREKLVSPLMAVGATKKQNPNKVQHKAAYRKIS